MIDNAIEVILLASMTAIYVIADRACILKPAVARRRLRSVGNRSVEK